MSFSISRLLTDESKKQKGVWIRFAPGLRLLICSTSTAEYQAAAKRHNQQVRGLLSGILDDADVRPFICKLFAKLVLRDWDGLTEDDEVTPIPYSEEKATDLLMSSDELYNFVSQQAANPDNFRPDLAEAEKN